MSTFRIESMAIAVEAGAALYRDASRRAERTLDAGLTTDVGGGVMHESAAAAATTDPGAITVTAFRPHISNLLAPCPLTGISAVRQG